MLQHAALARQLAPATSLLVARLVPAAAAGFHRAAAALQEAAPDKIAEAAPEKMAEAAAVVAEVMGEGSEVAPPPPPPLPASKLDFGDARAAFKASVRGLACLVPVAWLLTWAACSVGRQVGTRCTATAAADAGAACGGRRRRPGPGFAPPALPTRPCRPPLTHPQAKSTLDILPHPALLVHPTAPVLLPQHPPHRPSPRCLAAFTPPISYPPITSRTPQAKSTLDIVRSLLVFRACQVGPLVAHADAVLAWSKRVFGPRLTNWGIRHSFYKQFVAGEVAAGSVCLRSRLAARACAPAGTPTGAGPDRRRCAPAACVPPARWPATPSRTWLPALPTPPLCGRVC